MMKPHFFEEVPFYSFSLVDSKRCSGAPCRADEASGLIERNPHFDLRQRLFEASLVEERAHEAAVGKRGKDLRRDAAAQIHAAEREHLEGEVARLGTVDVDEHFERVRADVVAMLEGNLAHHRAGVFLLKALGEPL